MKYIIKKLWVDPMENRNADGYSNFAVADTIEQAEKFISENQEMWGRDRCWSLFEPTPLYIVHGIKELGEL